MREQRVLRQSVCLLLCFLIVFSLAVIALGASHTCGDKACRTCGILQACRALLDGIFYAFVPAGLFRLGAQAVAYLARNAPTHKAVCTLVSLKVKLSN